MIPNPKFDSVNVAVPSVTPGSGTTKARRTQRGEGMAKPQPNPKSETNPSQRSSA
jgi:hypothetical protein